jgi:hypothetical protein
VVAFVASFVILVLGTALAFAVGARRPKGTPLTWAEAVMGGTYVLGLLLLAYGILPNQWMLWAGKMNWTADKTLYVVEFFDRGRIIIHKGVLTDIIATAIYIVLLGVNIFLWAVWQKRPTAEQKVARASELKDSSFGRPVIRAGGD